jgi:hypothetical protein
VRVPDDSVGKAKITVSYPGWSEGNVAPAAFEIPIAETKPKAADDDRFRSLLDAERSAIANIKDLGGKIDMEEEEVVAVRLQGDKVTDDRLMLRHLPFIRSLELRDCPITNDELRRLAGLEHLKTLNIEGARITDEGLQHVAEMRNLEILDLSRTRVTDAGLPRLRGLSKLKKLNVSGTGATEKGLKMLRETLPNLETNRN